MAYWIQRINRIPKGLKVQLPAQWCKDNLKPDDKYVMIEDNGNKTLTIMSIGRWAVERDTSNTDNKN